MVTLRLQRGPDGRLCGFEATGHTGMAAPGQDVACAAVSALTQSAALGLERHLGIDVTVVAGQGRFGCRLPSGLPADVRLRAEDILETMRLGLVEIARLEPTAVRLVDSAAGRQGRWRSDVDL